MLKLAVAVFAIVIASAASAAGWRSLLIDASSEASFQESVAAFQEKLTPSRRIAFARSLQDVWLHGSRLAQEQQGEYTIADFLRQLHGLRYDEVVKLTDPTGEKAGAYRAAYYASRRWSGGAGQSGNPRSMNPLWTDNSTYSTDRIPYRGWTDLTGPGQR